MKRGFDLGLATVLTVLLAIPMGLIAIIIRLQDGGSPFYVGRRVGLGGRIFSMVKFRSMVVRAAEMGGMSTAADDPRVTRVGRLIRALKFDEFPQLFNILRGDMSFVGPRPNVESEVALYSDEERVILAVRPGITDFASIVFADEGRILEGAKDPDRTYNLLIRPWKSRLGLHYVLHRTMKIDLALIIITGLALVSRSAALWGVDRLLGVTGADEELRGVARRPDALVPSLPPGVSKSTWDAHLTSQ